MNKSYSLKLKLKKNVTLRLHVRIMSHTRFQSESTLYSCLNVKELLAQSWREILSLCDCNWTSTHNHLVHKWQVWLNGRVFIYELSGCGFKSS